MESKERMGQLDFEANMFPCGASAWFARFFGGATNGTLTCIETDADKTLNFLNHHQASTVYSSPDHLFYLLSAAREDLKFIPKVKSVTVCGGAITSSAVKAVSQFNKKFPNDIGAPKKQTEVKYLYDDKNLYFGFDSSHSFSGLCCQKKYTKIG
jgi:hypothetical protein